MDHLAVTTSSSTGTTAHYAHRGLLLRRSPVPASPLEQHPRRAERALRTWQSNGVSPAGEVVLETGDPPPQAGGMPGPSRIAPIHSRLARGRNGVVLRPAPSDLQVNHLLGSSTMNTKQKRTLQAFRRIQGWIIAHPELASATQTTRPALVTSGSITPAESTATLGGVSAEGVSKLIGSFNSALDRITQNAADEDAHDRAARGHAAEIGRARKELFDHNLRQVAIMAETAMPDVVRMTVALRRPRARDAEGMLAAADAMVQAVAPYRQLLVQRGLPSDFVEQLSKAAASYKAAIDSRGGSVAARHRAGQVLEESVQAGRRLVAALTIVVERRYRDDRGLIAEWRQLKHVALVGARTAGGDVESPLAPAAQQQPVLSEQKAA